MPGDTRILNGRILGIGIQDALLEYYAHGVYHSHRIPLNDHADAVQSIVGILIDDNLNITHSITEIRVVTYFVPHGGTIDTALVPLSDENISKIRNAISLSFNKNASALAAFYALHHQLPSAAHIGAVDTAFHQTMEPMAFLYGLPYSYYDTMGVRKYGFYGIVHQEAVNQACAVLNTSSQDKRVIVCHVDNDISICAVQNGFCIDVSNGFSQNEGPVMATRCGSCDPTVVDYLVTHEGMSLDETIYLLNARSGLTGLCGCRRDMRDLPYLIESGNSQAKLAFDMQIYSIQKYIGAYIAAMRGVDTIVFTGEAAVNLPDMRADILSCFDYLSIKIDSNTNMNRTYQTSIISSVDSAVDIVVAPIEIDRTIAQYTYSFFRTNNV